MITPKNLGYACINTRLKENKIMVNRSMNKKTFELHGPEYCGVKILDNLKDLEKIIDWNVKNNFHVYRMSSSMFPWMSEYEIPQLPQFQDILIQLRTIGKKIKLYNQRVSFHPGHFNILCSPRDNVVNNTIKELNQHAEIMDYMGLKPSHQYHINIHVGGAYGDKKSALDRFIDNFSRLHPNTKARLTVENDDKPNMYSTKDLYYLHSKIGIPIVFDYLHHSIHTGGQSEEDAFNTAYNTWPSDIIPIVHYSSSKRKHEDPDAKIVAHADYLYENINTYGKIVDIEFEAKAKEDAVIKWRSEYLKMITS